MADTPHINQEVVNLEKNLQNMQNVLKSDLLPTYEKLVAVVSDYYKVFNKSQDELEDMLDSSEELRRHHEKSIELMQKYNNLLRQSDDAVKNVAQTYNLSNDEAQQAISYTREYLNLEREKTKLIEQRIEQEKKALDVENQLKAVGQDISMSESERLANIMLLTQELAQAKGVLESTQDSINDVEEKGNKILEDAVNLNITWNDIANTNGPLASAVSTLDDMAKGIRGVKNELELTNQEAIQLEKSLAEANKRQDETISKIISSGQKIWGFAAKIAKQGADKWTEIDHKTSTFVRTVGLSATQIGGLRRNILDTYDDLASKLGMTFEEIFKFQEQYVQNTGRAIMLTNEQVETLAGMSKIVGDDAITNITKNMDDFGASNETATDYLALNMARARLHGLDAKKASEAFANNIKMASKYTFSEGVNGISKMTMLSQQLKFNIESIGSSLDKFSTIEGAIETSANIQMLGGAYALNFSNPLTAMGEALLDAEGFINRIVNTVSSQALFDRTKGMVEMSGFEKARLKEFAKQMGLDYNDVWNMVSQQTKIQAIKNDTRLDRFSEAEQNLIANKAQYDTEKQQWVINMPGGASVEVSKLDENILSYLKDSTAPEEAIRSDVHEIRNLLRDFTKDTVLDTRSWKETLKGIEENVSIDIARQLEPFLSPLKDILGGYASAGNGEGLGFWAPGILSLVGSVGGVWAPKALQTIGKRIAPKPTVGGASGVQGGMGLTSDKGLVNAFKRTPKGTAVRANMGKALKGGLTSKANIVTNVGAGVVRGVMSAIDYQQALENIEHNSSLSSQEKELAKNQAKNELSKGVGGAIGSTGGGILGSATGAAIGTAILPGVGTIIGGLLGGIGGGILGDQGGSALGDLFVKDLGVSDLRADNVEETILQEEANDKLSYIEHNTRAISNQLEKMGVVPSDSGNLYATNVKPKTIAGEAQYISTSSQSLISNNNKMSFDKIEIDMSGSLQLVGNDGQYTIKDIGRQLASDNDFMNKIQQSIYLAINTSATHTPKENRDNDKRAIYGLGMV